MTNYPLLKEFKGTKAIYDLDSDLLKEIQHILKVEVTGICCKTTAEKFAEFKEKNYLEHSDLLGPTTALSLIESVEAHQVTEQTVDIPTKVQKEAGSKTGRSAVIPLVGLVYQHEYIVEGIPLTWGEMTKGLDARRIPSTEEVVRNLMKTAKVFGIARAKYGKPVAVSSGYRPAHLGIGARRSQHILAKAGDTFPLMKSDIKQWYNILRVTPGVMGLGDAMSPKQGGFVHFDLREERSQVRFGYGV